MKQKLFGLAKSQDLPSIYTPSFCVPRPTISPPGTLRYKQLSDRKGVKRRKQIHRVMTCRKHERGNLWLSHMWAVMRIQIRRPLPFPESGEDISKTHRMRRLWKGTISYPKLGWGRLRKEKLLGRPLWETAEACMAGIQWNYGSYNRTYYDPVICEWSKKSVPDLPDSNRRPRNL